MVRTVLSAQMVAGPLLHLVRRPGDERFAVGKRGISMSVASEGRVARRRVQLTLHRHPIYLLCARAGRGHYFPLFIVFRDRSLDHPRVSPFVLLFPFINYLPNERRRLDSAARRFAAATVLAPVFSFFFLRSFSTSTAG